MTMAMPYSRVEKASWYFTKFTPAKGCFYLVVVFYLVATSLVVILEPFVTIPCPVTTPALASGRVFSNPAFDDSECRNLLRFAKLLWLTRVECDHGRRILFSVLGGGIIGWERRSSDRPAGIRTMALVSLGSCIFTLASMGAFLTGPMTWDASRVTAAIPSGVGFLGAGMIWKQSIDSGEGGTTQTVHGLTTAASLWLSAAVGISAGEKTLSLFTVLLLLMANFVSLTIQGGAMYFICSFCIAVMVVLLRFGPRITDPDEVDPELDATQVLSFDNTSSSSTIGLASTAAAGRNGGYGGCGSKDAHSGLSQRDLESKRPPMVGLLLSVLLLSLS
jgi:hypothetical protein